MSCNPDVIGRLVRAGCGALTIVARKANVHSNDR